MLCIVSEVMHRPRLTSWHCGLSQIRFLRLSFSSYPGFLNGIYVGCGEGGGTIIGGALIDHIGIRATYRIYAGLAIAALVLHNVLQGVGEKNDEHAQSKAAYKALPSDEN